MKLLRWATYLVALFVLAGMSVAIIIDDDPWCCAQFAVIVKSLLENTLQTSIALRGHQVRLINGNVLITDVAAQADDGSWQWHIGTMELQISWRQFVAQRKIIISCVLHNLSVYSRAVGQDIAIIPHIQKLFQPMPDNSPLVIDRVAIDSAMVKIEHQGGTTIAMQMYADGIQGHVPLGNSSNRARTMSVHWYDGVISSNEQIVVSDISGYYRYDYGKKSSIYDMQALWNVQALQHQRWYLRGYMNATKGSFHGGTSSGSSDIVGFYDLQDDVYKVEVGGPCCIGAQAMPFMKHLGCSQGDIKAVVTGSCKNFYDNMSIAGTISNMTLYGIEIPHIEIQGEHIFSGGKVTVQLHDPSRGSLQGVICCRDVDIQMTINNQLPILLMGGYTVPGHSLQMSCCFAIDNLLNARARCRMALVDHEKNHDVVNHDSVREALVVEGSWKSDGNRAEMDGAFGNYTYRLTGSLQDRCIYYADVRCENNAMIELQRLHGNILQGGLDYQLLNIILRSYGLHIPGEGKMALSLNYEDKTLYSSVELTHAMMRLPYMYNLLQDFSAKFAYRIDTKKLIGSCCINLHKGAITSSQITCLFDDANALQFMQAPLVLSECLVSSGKDLFSSLSGAGSMRYERDKPAAIQGFVSCDRSHARGNIFSQEFQHQIMGFAGRSSGTSTEVMFDVHGMTRSPLRVQTSFLDCSAHVSLHGTGSLRAPRVSGDITIVQGAFLFPYKPLFIKRGIIYMTEQIDDPAVEIIAENSIKGHQIKLHVTGTARDPHITFESTNGLSEEQIIGLLWGGSEDGSLYLAMSTMIMQSLERLIFGPSSTTSLVQQKLQQLFRPLGNVRIVPSFTDQTGRGGLRGSLAIEVNDRLRGIIQQNFDLPEDTLYQVEYDISDEVRMRAFKDERSDLGAEIEGRWKF